MNNDTVFLSIIDPLNDGSVSVPASADDAINIVLAADKTYFYPMLCVIKSACANKNPSTKYQFILLVDDDFSSEHEKIVNSLLRKYGLPVAKIYNRASEYLEVEYAADHLTRASCYRLQIPTLLENVNKCIYLDCDILVRKDLSDFYEMLEENDLIVGVLAAAYQLYPNNAKAKAELLGLPNIDSYTNSGVMVMNLRLMRDLNIERVFDEMLEKDFPDIDQDILNAACYGMVHLAPPKFNAMTKYRFDDDSYNEDPSIAKCWTYDEWEEARTDPAIVHFADTDKPWTDYALPFAKEWWGHVRDMGMTEEIFDFFYDLHAKRQSSVYEMRMSLIAKDRELADHRNAHNKEREDLLSQLDGSKATVEKLKKRVAAKNERIEKQKERISTLREKLTVQRRNTVEVQKLLKSTRKKLNAVKGSKSYKLGRAITRPYRSIKGGNKK